MNSIYEKINENLFKLVLSKKWYSKEAVFSALYKFNEYGISKVSPLGEDEVIILFKVNKNVLGEMVIHRLISELVDQQLRNDIMIRTDLLRKEIYEEAFRPLKGN